MLLLWNKICIPHHRSSLLGLRRVDYVVIFDTYLQMMSVWVSAAASNVPAEDFCGFSEPVQESEGNKPVISMITHCHSVLHNLGCY